VPVRRAQMFLVPSIEELRRDGLPVHLQRVLEGLRRELRLRAFLPMVAAPTLERAVAATQEGFEVFCELAPAIVGALQPWYEENPTRLSPAGQLARDVWESRAARNRLGDAVCADFAAAQDARILIAKTILQWPELKLKPVSPETRKRYSAIVPLILSTDYALLLGVLAISATRAPSWAKGVPEWISWSSRKTASDAYAIVAIDEFSDRPRQRRPGTSHES
jgi:hypothetical protein